ncbi:MAG: orotidine-5'-phosphate decarboxylase [Candidatus Babeliales bacterium]
MNFHDRASYAQNPVAKKLFNLMDQKRTNLAVAADVTTKQQLLDLARMIGPEICFLKTHIDIVEDFDWDLIEQLQHIAQTYNFLLIEDRKFCDIGSTVQAQYTGGIHKICSWADATIAHAISGEGIIKALETASAGYDRGLLLLAHMSSQGNLIDETYSTKVCALAEKYTRFVMGCICQKKCLSNAGMIHVTPGIHMQAQGDMLGQQFTSPEKAIIEQGTDIIIVGRGIYAQDDQRAAAQRYRQAAWNAYQSKLSVYKEICAVDCQPG